MQPTFTIHMASSEMDYEAIRLLVHEYETMLSSLGAGLAAHEQMPDIPGIFSPPNGCFFIARLQNFGKINNAQNDNVAAAGCIGIRPLEPGIAELKRLYVPPPFRGYGLGERLMQTAMDWAKDAGYHRIRLDSLERLGTEPLNMRLGFERISAYNNTAFPDIYHMEKCL